MCYKCNAWSFDLNISTRFFLLPLEFFFVVLSLLFALGFVLGEFLEGGVERLDLGDERKGVHSSVIPR
jgi:hypothetical protein